MSRPSTLFGDYINRPQKPDAAGTVLSVSPLGTVDVQLASGEVIRRIELAGAAAAGDEIRLRYDHGRYVAQGSRTGGDRAGGAYVLGGVGGGGTSGAPSPHDLLGLHHNLPTLAANLFLASPVSASGLPSFRAIAPADLPGQFSGFANPSAQIGLTAVNGVATTAMRSDAAPALNQAISPTWSGLHTFGAGATIAAGQYLNFGADVSLTRFGANVLATGADDSVRSPNFVSGVAGWTIDGTGDAEFNNIVARGELRAFVFKINELSATAGTFGVFYSASTAYVDFTTPASTGSSFTFGAKNSDAGGMLFGVGDILRTKAWTGTALADCWFTITARTNNTTYTTYTATLNSGSTSTTIREGTAIVDYGPSGTGAITLSTDGTVGSTPNLTMFKHAGAPWTTITPLLRIGNLNGYGSYATNVFGVAIGDPAGAWMTAEGNVVKMRQGANDVIVLDGAANSSYFAGVMTIGTSGEIRQGTGTVGSNFTGIRLFNSGGVGYLAGYTGGGVQWYGDTDGKLKAGAGSVVLDATGISIYAAGTGIPESNRERSYSLLDGGGVAFAKFGGNRSSKSAWVQSAGTNAVASLWATDPTSGYEAIVSCDTYTPLIDLKINGTVQLSARNGFVYVPNTMQVGNFGASAYGGIGAGSTTKLYSPTNTTWVNESTLILTGGNGGASGGYSVIAFHESGQRVDFIRVGASIMDLGYDGGFGSATVRVPNALGVGASPANNTYDRLTVAGGAKTTGSYAGFGFEARDNASQSWVLYANSSAARIYGAGADQAWFTTSGSAYKRDNNGSWATVSDARIKVVQGEYTLGLSEIERVRPIEYRFNGQHGIADDGRLHVGIIAQEIRAIFPNTITEGSDPDRMLSFNQDELVYALINSVKTLSARVKELEQCHS